MRSASTRVLTAVLAACVVVGFATASFGQAGGNGDGFRDASERADARGGNGGDVRGGDGGRGGNGVLPVCNQNSSDGDYEDATVDCIAGSSGGNGGNAGESVGGNGGVAFTIGPPPPPAQPSVRRILADLGISQVFHSFDITVVNGGPDPATGVMVTGMLAVDQGFGLSGISASQGSCGNVEGFYADGMATYTCSLGTIAPGGSATIVLNTPITDGAAAATNDVIVSSNTADPNVSNNRSKLTVVINR
jgi:hypothetical protein